jgi:SAM-dependent methyltransferase
MPARERRRFAILPRLGIWPASSEIVKRELESAFEAASGGAPPPASGASPRDGAAPPGPPSPPGLMVLDAGCGRVSALRPFRPRIARFVGADIHAPATGALAHLDEFATVDLCTDDTAFAPRTFDVILSSFTVEHFADPDAAFRNFRGWLRPGGRLVITTVNRRHPFVWAYLAMPGLVRGRLQRLVKATAADSHPIVGACNSPGELQRALAAAGFADVRVTTVGHLARAWGRRWPTYLVGLAGDLLTQGVPSRRSTLVVSAG